MVDASSAHDPNSAPTLTGVSNVDGSTVVRVYADPVTHRLLVDSEGSSGGTGTWYAVSGALNGTNVTFTVATAVGSDFLLFLARQPQMPTTDFTYSAGVSTTTITYASAPDASLSGQPHYAYVVS